MSRHRSPGPRTPLLVRVYALLLWLYPAGFRREYGEEMLRVLRDRLREARQTGRLGRSFLLWSWALGDLARTALAERFGGGVAMNREAWVRLGGAAAMLGGVIMAAELVTLMSWTVSSVVSDAGLAGALVFASLILAPLLFLGGTIVLAGQMRGHELWFVLPGFLLVILGWLAYIAASVLFWLSAFYGLSVPTSSTVLDQSVYPLLILGFVLVGIATVRVRPLPFGNVFPLLLAVLYVILYTQQFISLPLGSLPLGGVLVRTYLLVNVLSGLVWTILGVSLWRSATQAEQAYVTSAQR